MIALQSAAEKLPASAPGWPEWLSMVSPTTSKRCTAIVTSFGAGAVFLRMALVRGGVKKRGLRKNMERVGWSGVSSYWENFLLDQANQSLQKSME